MKRPRPHIPIKVRLQVAIRQAVEADIMQLANFPEDKRGLDHLLSRLFRGEKFHLDHNPALILRKFNPRTGKYSPDANDPAHLIYRTIHDHHIKTNVRGDGAQRSDTSERVHWRKVARNKIKRACKKKPKYATIGQNMQKRPIPSRPFPQGRKFESARR